MRTPILAYQLYSGIGVVSRIDLKVTAMRTPPADTSDGIVELTIVE
jgi:hypothetical protein